MIQRYVVRSRNQPLGAIMKKDDQGALCYYDDCLSVLKERDEEIEQLRDRLKIMTDLILHKET